MKTPARRIPKLALAFAAFVLTSSLNGNVHAASFVTNSPLARARASHTATLLPNGKVLVVGGFGTNGHLASAELYDPDDGTWTGTGVVSTVRRYHTATLLPNGKVLIAGGQDNTFAETAGSELYDPATGTWAATDRMVNGRYLHTATLLPNGKVFVAGGIGGGTFLASAELYDPATGTWTNT